MNDIAHRMKDSIDRIALRVITLEPGDIPAMGEILNDLSSFQTNASELDDPAPQTVARGLRQYIEKLILEEKTDLTPLEDSITVLQDICGCLINNQPYPSDLTPIMQKLGAESDDEVPPLKTTTDNAASSKGESAEMLKEELETYRDFVVETLENLGKIEVNLIDLEECPHGTETINTIFRAFHTIKGVSGFLNLKKINRLAHSTESILDCARAGEFKITDSIIDMVLASVDTLKQLINCVELAIAIGDTNLEGDIDLDPLIDKLEETLRVSRQQNKRIGEMLVETGAINEEDLKCSLNKQKTEPEKKIGSILVDERMVEPKEVIQALRDQKRGPRLADFQVKVDTLKLDNLVDLTGELVISQSMLRQSSVLTALNDQQFNQNLSRLTQIVSSLQKTAMSMRMVPLKSTFQKMFRLIRDLSKTSGKDVGLEMFGEDTEIDRNVVEELYEPLVHMIRNAVDHGLETPEERKNQQKPLRGTIRLKAYQRGGNIIIEISDDGRGINKEEIVQHAVSMGLIENDMELSEADIFGLIFHPGLSTAKEVTDISGRGVGMDVVKKRIEKLHGRLEIDSTPGQGCTVYISLPLTLAIIDGMVVRVGLESYIIPTLAIVESFQPNKEDYHTIQGKGEMVKVRGNLIPLIRLDRVFGLASERTEPWEGLVVVVENNGKRGGLLLDELLRQEEIVIKSLGDVLKGLMGFSGGAILGDGKVGLILDVAGLLELSPECAA